MEPNLLDEILNNEDSDREEYDQSLVDNILDEEDEAHQESYPEPLMDSCQKPKTPVFTPNPAPSSEVNRAKLNSLLYGHVELTTSSSGPVSPLDLLHQQELEDSKKTEKKLKHPLKNKRDFSNKRHPLVHFEEIRAINRRISAPEGCPGIFPNSLAASAHFIAVGNRQSQVFLFTNEGQELRTLAIKRQEFGEVVSIDISFDEQLLVGGFEKGQIAFWDLRSGACIKASNTVHSHMVLSVCFWSASKPYALSSDLKGKIAVIEYSKSVFSSSFQVKRLFNGELGVCPTLKALMAGNFQTEFADVVALGALKKVLVLRLEPEVEEIFAFERPDAVQSGASPCLSWNKLSEERPPLLAIGWGKKVFLYEIRRLSREFVNFCGVYDMGIEVKGLEWLQARTMIAVSKVREIREIALAEFSKRPQESAKILQESLPQDFATQSFLQYSDSQPNVTIYNAVKCVERTVYIIGLKSFNICRLLDSNEYLEKLRAKQDWLDAMSFGVDAYHNKVPFFHGSNFNEDQVRSVLEELISEYVKGVKLRWDLKIVNVIEFCVEIGSLDLLFNEFFQYFLKFGDGEENLRFFMDTLEPYVLSDQIRAIPPSILDRVIMFYRAASRTDIIERIILHLDPSSLDPKQLLPICKDYNLVTASIYINTQTVKRFVSPLNLLYNSLLKQEVRKDKQLLAYKLLWYVRLCLRGLMFPSGTIQDEVYPTAVARVLSTLIRKKVKNDKEKNYLKVLLSLDTKTTFDVLWEAFEGKSSEVLLKLELAEAPTPQELLARLSEEIPENSPSAYRLTMFIAKVAAIDKTIISKEISIKVIREIVRPSYSKPANRPLDRPSSIARYIELVGSDDSALRENEDTVEEKSEMILNLMKNCLLTDTESSELFNLLIKTPYTQAIVHLQELRGEYKECVSTFIRSENEAFKAGIFDWLNGVFPKISEGEREMLKREVMESLNVLVTIDTEKTAKIIKEWYQDSHITIIEKLSKVPKLQKKYLGKLVKNDKDEVLSQDMVMRYIELLCEHSSGKVLPFLKNREKFPLEMSLEICKRYNLKEATSYLYERLGESTHAVELYLDIIRAKLGKLLSQTALEPKAYDELLSEINADIDEAFAICKRNAKNLAEHDNSDLWFPLLSVILEMHQKFQNHLLFSKIEILITKSIRTIIESMIDYIAFDTIVYYIDNHFGKVPFKYFKESFTSVLSRYSYQSNIVKTAISLLNSDIKNMTQKLYQMRIKGITSQDYICGKCKVKINFGDMLMNYKEKLVLFVCGHAYHGKCSYEEKCLICVQEEAKQVSFR